MKTAMTGLAAGLVLKTSATTLRVQEVGREHADRALERHGAIIYAIWHGRFWVPAAILGHEGTALLISRSADGEIIARATRLLGYHSVRGSSSRGGQESLKDLDSVLSQGRNAAITPDGPRGPRHHAQMGVVALASRSGKPIVPLSAASKWNRTLSSWDRFQVPLVGSPAAVVYGSPMEVPKQVDLEPYRLELQEQLTQLEHEADARVGLTK